MKIDQLDSQTRQDLFDYLLRLGDDRLILGHRLSEWCGHGPILEEDIALTNIALDLIGQASTLLKLAGEVEGNGRSEDDLAYLRDAIDFKNLMLVELPRGDFGFTIARQFLFSLFSYYLWEQLQHSAFEPLMGIAGKAIKEVRYHLRHSREWMLRLGDGTEESHRRVQKALNDMWPYVEEMFDMDEVEQRLLARGVAADLSKIKPEWEKGVRETLAEATLSLPTGESYRATGSRRGFHTEHLGHLLAEMQFLPRAYPGAKW